MDDTRVECIPVGSNPSGMPVTVFCTLPPYLQKDNKEMKNTDYIDKNRIPTQADVDKAIDGMIDAGIISRKDCFSNREELEKQGWVYEERTENDEPDSFLKTITGEEVGELQVRIFQENWITLTSKYHYIPIPMKSFELALAVAEALTKGVE